MGVDVVILLGGFGTRLKDISRGLPKSLMPIGNQSFLEILIHRVFKFEIRNIYLSLYYKSELFSKYLKRTNIPNRLIPIVEPDPLGTGGAVNYAISNYAISNIFFVINGDTLSDLNLDKMYLSFQEQRSEAMIGLSSISDVERYGKVEIENNKIINITEKGIKGFGWINNGHYIFKKSIFKNYSGSFSLEKDIFPAIIQQKKLSFFKVDNDKFIDIGIPIDYYKLHDGYRVDKNDNKNSR